MLKKIFGIGLPLGVLTTLLGWGICGKLFVHMYKIEPLFVWRTAEQMNPNEIWALYIPLSLILVWVFGMVKDGLTQKCRVMRGLQFGLAVFLVGALPGAVNTYLFTVTAPTSILFDLSYGLFIALIQGLFISSFYDKKLPFYCCSGISCIWKK